MTSAPKLSPASRAVFLDRDGTLNEDTGHIFRVEELRLLPNVARGLLRLAGMDFRLIVVTNQAGIAHGYFTEEQMELFNAALVRELAGHGVRLDRIYHCPCHPRGTVERFRQMSPDRKPNPGMLKRAAADYQLDLSRSYIIGDRDVDVLAGHNAGCTTILLAGAAPEAIAAKPHFIVADLVEAAAVIEKNEASKPRP
jgi:D-glycero-D-manno-heptose 1,7-bisphosphate phosphatase